MKISEFPQDPLFEAERTIARRADELSRELGTDRDHSLMCWRQAEREFWGTGEPSTPLAECSGHEV